MSSGPPLLELSRLLEIEVTDVRQTWVYTEGRGRPTSPNARRLEPPGARYGLDNPEWTEDGRRWSRPVKSREFRSRTAPHPMPHPRGQPAHRARPRAVSDILRNAS